MHPELLKTIVSGCRENEAAGDFALPIGWSVETLIRAIVQLAESATENAAAQAPQAATLGGRRLATPDAAAPLTEDRLLQIREELGTGVHQRLFLNIARAVESAVREQERS